MQQPLAVAIISGLLVQVPLAVIVLPLLYRFLGTVARTRSPGRQARQA
jgi:multidrug efflux pump subunit AcrB